MRRSAGTSLFIATIKCMYTESLFLLSVSPVARAESLHDLVMVGEVLLHLYSHVEDGTVTAAEGETHHACVITG